MPQYVKNRDGTLIEVPKAVEAERSYRGPEDKRPKSVDQHLKDAGFQPPEPPGFTEAALALLREKEIEPAAYDGPATGADGRVLKSDVEEWIDAEGDEEE